MEEKDVVEKGKINRRFILLATFIIVILILSTSCLYYYFYIYGSEGEVELTVELIDENVIANTTFQLKYTLTNTGSSGLRLVDPLVDRAKRAELGLDNIHFEYPNGTTVERSSYLVSSGILHYYYDDLIILSPGESIEYYGTVSADFYKFDVPGTYSITVSYISADYTDDISVAMWAGTVQSVINVVIT